jgi:hypothetical protein
VNKTLNNFPSHYRVVTFDRFAARLRSTATALVFLLAAVTPTWATDVDLTLPQNAQFDFGKIVPGQTGTVTIAAGSGCSRTANPTSLVVAASSCSAARFTVTDPSEKVPSQTYTYTVTLPSSPVTLTSAGGGTMTLSNFTTNPAHDMNNDVTYTGSCINASTGLSCPLYVGATLTISSSPSAAGAISGTYNLTVNFKN